MPPPGQHELHLFHFDDFLRGQAAGWKEKGPGKIIIGSHQFKAIVPREVGIRIA